MQTSPTRKRWQIIALMFVVGVLMFIDRVNISIAAKYIMPEYGLTDVQMGWVFSAFLLGYALMQVPGGMLGDRFGPRRVLAGAILWWSFFTSMTAVAGDWFLASSIGVVGSFVVVRALIGLGEAAGPPNYNRIIASWMAPGERGLASGLVTGGGALGAALAPPAVVWIMTTLGWREAFHIFGGVGIGVALLSYWIIRDRPAEHPGVNAAELAIIGSHEASAPARSSVRTPWRTLFKRPDLWLLTASYGALGYCGYLFFSWFYLYLVNERGFSVVTAGWMSTIPFFLSTVAAPAGGWMSDRLSERYGKRIGRCGFAFGCTLVAAIAIAAGAAAPDRNVAVVFLSVGDAALFFSIAVYWATSIDLARTHAGTVGGLMNMGGNLGGAISPTMTPLIAHSLGWDVSLYVAAGIAVLAGLLWLGVKPERPIELDQGETPSDAATPSAPASASAA